MLVLSTSYKDQAPMFLEMLELFLETVLFKDGKAVIPVDE